MKKTKGNLLIVDDNQDILDALSLFIENEFKKTHYLSNPNLIPEYLRKYNIDLVLLDMNFSAGINSGNEGVFWMKEILKHDKTISVIPITAYGEVQLAVKALKEGAVDFILKPWDNDKLISTLKSALELRISKLKVKELEIKNETLINESNNKFPSIQGVSTAIKKINQIIDKVAHTRANILILGENGTGKELTAREIYKKSDRKKEVFVSVDLGSLSESLFESELFGHEKGAFTDSKSQKIGRFESANNGTILLDEIGNIPLSLQSKLLSVLQNNEIYRLGSSTPIPVNIRLICATNRNLEKMINDGQFRDDLYYRINTIQIELPALRERENDIDLLSEFFVNKYASMYNKINVKISRKALTKLKSHTWPGNIRELEHTIEKAIILTDNQILSDTDFNLRRNNNSERIIESATTLEEIEKNAILLAIQNNNGNLTEAAKKLAISRQTMYNKISKYGIKI